MGLDAVGKYAGLGMVPFFIRAAGGGSMEARHAAEEAHAQANAERVMSGKPPIEYKRSGEEVWKELAYGLTTGTIELATEKLFDGVAGVFGKGAADEIVESLIGKLSNSNIGRTVLRAVAGAAGEGAEEVISDLLEPFAQRIYNDDALKELAKDGYDWGEMFYDFMIGAAVGGMGAVGSIASGENAKKNAMLDYKMIEDAYNNASKTSAFSKNTANTDNLGAELAKTEENNADYANYGEKNTAPEGTEGTYINTDPAIHTAEEQKTINNYVKAVDDKIKNFISKVRTLNNPKYRSSVRLEISEVNPVLTEKIKELTGVNTTGFKNIITGGTIDHIIKRHGESGYADNSMRYENDIARIPYVLENFDGAYQLKNKDGSPSVSDVWKNSDGTGAKRVVLWKKLDGTYYIAQAAPDSKAHVLAIESAFIGSEKNIKKESTDEVLNMPVSVPQVTPETPHHANAFLDTNISYEQRKSNENRFQSGQEGENYNKKAAEQLGEPAYGSHGEMDAHMDEANAATIDSAQAIGISNGNYEQEENYERTEADYRGQERRLPDSTGTENGVMGKSSGRGTKAAEQIRAAGERQNRGRNLPQISSRELGLDGGTDRYNLKLIPSQLWDNELRDTAEKIRRESGREVSFVLGKIEVQGSAGMRYVRGIITDSKIIVQADHTRLSVAQIAEHELYHSAAEATPGTNWYCEQKIKEKYGEEEFNKVVEKYIEKLRGIIDVPENGTEAEIEEALNAIKEEIFADAYAGINAFGAHAEKFRSEVRQTVEERSGEGREQKAPETRGPPKYSLDDTEIPTYEQLIAKPDIKIVDLGNGFEGSFREKRKKIINTTQYSKPHWNKDTGALMFLSKNTLTHSFNNIGTEQLIAAEKLPEIIENAVLTHREPDKHGNETVSGVYTFFGAVRFNGETLPVKLKVKEYKTLNNMLPENVADYFEQHGKQDKYSKVYDSKVLSIEKVEIKIEPNGSEKRNQQNAESYLPPLGSVVSIRDLLSLVKGDAEKYIPKPASKLTSRGPSRKASMEDWEKAEKMRFMGLTDKEISERTGLVREGNDWYYPEKKHSEKYSIDEIQGKNGDYGQGVILDTPIFKDVKPRNWEKVLGNFVYENLAGKELTMYDEEGKAESVYLANERDRVKKDGAKNPHKVIDKLARYKGDNIRALATIHLSEALSTSREAQFNSEHSHQWMDEKGWEHRKTYLQDKDGNIYKATLNIANGRDKKILYDINQIEKIDTKKEPSDGAVPSTVAGRGSLINTGFDSNISQSKRTVKENRKASINGQVL